MPKSSGRRLKLSDAALPLIVLVVLGLIGYLLFIRPVKEAPKPTAPGEVVSPVRPPEEGIKPPVTLPAPPKPLVPPRRAALAAIIIDDLGSDMEVIEGVLALEGPVALAILPYQHYSGEAAQRAAAEGRDVLLHMPMEPRVRDERGLGRGALKVEMDTQTISRELMLALREVSGAVGVNNHMGSLFTEDAGAMAVVMEELRERGLFFVDSRTTGASVAPEAARAHGVPVVSRKVFLDDTDDAEEIRRQFGRLVELALKDGEAVAIGHPRAATIQVLREELPGLKARGVELVAVSRLAR